MSSQNKRIPENILQEVKRMLALQNQGGTSSVNEAAVPLLEPEISSESINFVAAASDESNLHPHTDNSVGGVDVAPVDTTSVVLEFEDVVKEAVKEPSISSGAVDVVMPASDYNVGPSSSPNAQDPQAWWSACEDVEGAGSACPEDDGEENDNSQMKGDSTVYVKDSFYFGRAPSKSGSKKKSGEVSRYDIAFIENEKRLMTLHKGESWLAFGIGGHLRTVVDWYLVRQRNEAAVSGWLPVSDPASPDVPLWIEFTAVFDKETVKAGTPLQHHNEALVLWNFMLNSARVGDAVNTQFFWCSKGPPRKFWTSVPICCRVVVDNLPVGSELFFDIAAVREQYRWSSVATKYAKECITRLDAGTSALDVQYPIIRGRAKAWAYGGTNMTISKYVEPKQVVVRVGRKKGRAPVSKSKKRQNESSSSSQVLSSVTLGKSPRRVAVAVEGADKKNELWRRAFNPDTLVLLAEYANSSTFEDERDKKRTALQKYVWWGQYLAERRTRQMDVSQFLEDRMDRYREAMANSNSRIRDARATAQEKVVDLISDSSDVEEGDHACSPATSNGPIEESKQRKRRGGSGDGAASKSRGKKKARVEVDSDAEEELDIGSDVEVEDSVHARDDTSETLRAFAKNLELVLIGMREALSGAIIKVRGLINSFPSER